MKLNLGPGVTIEVLPEVVILAGYTGRDQSAVGVHIQELEAQGVRPPASVPAYFVVPPELLMQGEVLRTPSQHSSGEAEFAIFVQGKQTYVTIASDHTDRAAERLDVQLSKQCCPKVVGRRAWHLEDVEDRWDHLVLRAWTGDSSLELYQEAALADLLAPRTLLRMLPWHERSANFCVFGGTTATLGGLREAPRFRAELADAETGRVLQLEYTTQRLQPLELAGGATPHDGDRARLAAGPIAAR